jgi:hypothetical protein
MSLRVGQTVKVAVSTIQRTSGAAWRGDQGVVISETGDGYRVKFGDGFIAENVKANELTT